MMVLASLGVFCVAFAVDVAYAYYIRRTAEGRAISAALWSGGIALSGAVNVLAYTHDRRLIVPMVFGYIAGTYWAVKRDHA
jgi:ABC-type transport system involved in cytochrome c biogenesis permease subunit